ncbi:MAG: uncharacterized protein KVP18_004512 [Porospora cf. gigantea A]|uniref:uncharacterized protein n=1 Tax=Porospora cf. gigantea A TaxID=2853593 RepID=UPI003559F891|nr:MAG: hypothetical protein KVP18_004512 [Porospora cf. gigantea A]
MRGATQAKFLNQVARCLEEVSVELTDLPIDRILWVEASSASVWGTFLLEAESRVFELVVSKVTPPDTYDMFAFPFEAADERPAQLQYWIRPKQEKEPDRKSTDPVLVIDDRLQFWRRPTPDSRLRKAVIRMANAMLKEWPRVGLPNVTFLSFPDMPNKLKGSYFVSILARCFLHTSYFGEIIKGCFSGHIKSRVADSVALKPLAYLQALHKVFYHVFKPDTPTSEYGRLGTEAYLREFEQHPLLRRLVGFYNVSDATTREGQVPPR